MSLITIKIIKPSKIKKPMVDMVFFTFKGISLWATPSTIVTKNNLYLDLTKYYDLIELACSLNSTLNERQFAPEDYIGLISNYYEQLIPRNETKTSASRAGVSVVCIYNDIKDYLDEAREAFKE